jgi:hypothetical protein
MQGTRRQEGAGRQGRCEVGGYRHVGRWRGGEAAGRGAGEGGGEGS